MQSCDDDDFVDPIAERLTLSGGRFVDIKRELTHGETEDMYALIFPYGVQDRRVVRTAKIDAYLLGWSLTRKGVPVPMSPELDPKARLDTIRSLSPHRAREIFDAIEAHDAARAAQRAAQKKTAADATTSSSPSAVAGPSASATFDSSASPTMTPSTSSSPRPPRERK